MTQTFKATAKQIEAVKLMGGPAMHILMDGGSRSGKTFNAVRAMCIRAFRAPKSRHLILRHAFSHVKQSIGMDTLPNVLRLCFPNVHVAHSKTDWFWTFPNGAEIWLGGLDDKERVDKILGKEYATILFEECSQFDYKSVATAWSRLAQKTNLALKAYYTQNPPLKSHWTYKLFLLGVEPASNAPLLDAARYARIFMRPADNAENVAPEYLEHLANMPAAQRRRFLDGEYSDDNPHGFWKQENFDECRTRFELLPQMQRVVVAIDPSGSDGKSEGADEIGIVVAGKGIDGRCYVLADLSCNLGPAGWARRAIHDGYYKFEGDAIVAEANFGGAMVEATLRSIAPEIPYKAVHAARGKHVRAEPVAALYEQGKVSHVGAFQKLEEQMLMFGSDGYVGHGSPDRADALVWALTELTLGPQRRGLSF